jgi:para-nitrobenzyl esterase
VARLVCRFNASRPSAAAFTLVAIATLFPFPGGNAWAEDNALIARTASGQIRGVPRPTGGAQFLGLPFAQPPVGELRWHAPLPAKPWSGVRDAAGFGAPCAQPVLGDWNRHDAEVSQEDCLFLNVVTPVWPAKEKLPVMFWIHGGGNEGGTASSALYNDGTLPQHGVVLVTVNYRLGIFGFFAHPELTRESAHGSSGNYGLMDQILALRWVIDNIAKFGGDPGNITVFGQSAGAQDTGLLMTSLAKDLFQRAIAESGTSFGAPLLPLAEAEQASEKFAASLKVPAGDGTLERLRQISPQDLLTALARQNPHPRFGPVIDGWVISRSPAAVFASGQESAIPLMFGTTIREFGSPASTDDLRKTIENAAGNFAAQALAAYGVADGGQRSADPLYGSAADQWAADIAFRCPATTQAEWHSAAHHPTYEYEFDHAIPGQEAHGAVHSSDLPYVFGYTDYKLADLMETYWTNFAKTGDPNSTGLPAWPQFGEAQTFIQFAQDGKVENAAGLRSRQCSIYREVLAERLKHGK